MYETVIDEKGLVRDTNSRAILVADKESYQNFQKKQKYIKNIKNQNDRLNALENKMDLILELLKDKE